MKYDSSKEMAMPGKKLGPEVPVVGEDWPRGSMIWGQQAGHGDWTEVRSPADGSMVQRVRLLCGEELRTLVQPPGPLPEIAQDDFWAFTARLAEALQGLAGPLLDSLALETAFVHADCEEMLSGSLAYVEGFRDYVRSDGGVPPDTFCQSSRRLRMVDCPWGTVAIILPQNAFLSVAVTGLLNALWTGNRVILRAPLQAGRSSALLAAAVAQAQAPQNSVSVILTRAKEFVQSLCGAPEPCLIHYMGSSRHVPQILSQACEGGKGFLADAEGNGWVYVDKDASLEAAADVLTQGAVRYNGQTCTSINGAIIHPSLYVRLRPLLIARWKALTAGNPLTMDADVGPLFDEGQAEHCVRQIAESGGSVLVGARREANLFTPTLVEGPAFDSGLVTHGLFGSALWISPGTRDEFVSWWGRNQYPLCAGVLSPSADPGWWLPRLGNLARLTINGDPSVEDVFEPWGGYARSGANRVGPWHEKYRRSVQVDSPFEVKIS